MDSDRLLIGVGNEFRSDDGIGLAIARIFKEKKIPTLIVKEESGEGIALMEAWQGFDNVILVDAVSSGAEPGKIYKIDANKEKVPTRFFHYSTHAFSVAEAVELARAVNKLPKKLIIYGIEGKNFSAGTDISKTVRFSLLNVIEQIYLDLS